MIQRFKIEDLVIQDTSGVVFKAVDEETGLPVSVRRFFPFGADGGGLDEAMQADYSASVARLAQVKHPALCSVIEGGCDPVDGMPYLVTEWMDGTLLIDFLANRPLSQPEAITLIIPLMEVCQLLSDAISHEGIWVETDFGNITLGTGLAHRSVAFRISPVKCLGQSEQHRGLFPLVELTARIMGWHQGVPEDLAVSGLGAWLNWLHGACESASIQEAMERLAVATGGNSPAPAVRKTRPVTSPATNAATRPISPARPAATSNSAAAPWLIGGLVLASLGLGGWFLIQKNGLLLVNAADQTILIKQEGKRVAVEGNIEAVSATKQFIYLEFLKNRGKSFRCVIQIKDAQGNLSQKELESLINKKVQVTGTIRVELSRPVMGINNRSAIRTLN